jgi:hypothetical protein
MLLPFLMWAMLVFIFGFNGLYGLDAHEYFRYTKALSAFFLHGSNPGNYFWPIGYPLLSTLPSLFLPAHLSMQLVGLLALLGTAWYCWKVLRLLYPEVEHRRVYLLLFVLCSPLMLRASTLIMSDVVAVFFSASTIYHFIRHRAGTYSRSLIWAIALSTAAFQCRYASLVILGPFVFYGLLAALRQKQWQAILFSMGCITLILLPDQLLRSSNSLLFLSNHLIENWSFHHFFSASFHTPEGIVTYDWPNIIFAFSLLYHPGFLLLILPFVVVVKPMNQHSTNASLLLISVVLYLAFLAGIPTQNIRFQLLALPPMAIFLFPYWHAAVLKIKSSRKPILFVGLLLLQLSFFALAMRPILALNALEKQIAGNIAQHTASCIYSFEMNVALNTYLPEKEWISLWGTTILHYRKGELVLFNENKFSTQWEGKSPMRNWERLKKQHQLHLLQTFDQGWQLYEIN